MAEGNADASAQEKGAAPPLSGGGAPLGRDS
jgi:hypothetical protein